MDVAARSNKYKQIHQELEHQLAQEQAKVRDLTDKNRQLKDKLRAFSALTKGEGGKEGAPFDPTKYQQTLQDKDDQIKKLEHDVQVLSKAKELAERREKVKAKENMAGKDHYREQAQVLEDELERKSKEVKENQVLIRKMQSQMRRMKLEISSLHKLNQDRIKLNAIMGEAPIEHDEDESDDGATSTFLTNLDPDPIEPRSQPSSRAASAASARLARPPPGKAGQPASKATGEKGPRGPGAGDCSVRRGNPGTPPSGGQPPSKGHRGDAKSRQEALAVRKPETPADLAGMLMVHKNKQAAAAQAGHRRSDEDDESAFEPYGRGLDDGKGKPPPPLRLGAMQAAAQAPAYEQLLSPAARSVLEDARSWRSATQTMRSDGHASPEASSARPRPAPSAPDEEEGGYEDDFESVASSRPPASAPNKPAAAVEAEVESPRADSVVEDEVEEEDMDLLLAGLT